MLKSKRVLGLLVVYVLVVTYFVCPMLSAFALGVTETKIVNNIEGYFDFLDVEKAALNVALAALKAKESDDGWWDEAVLGDLVSLWVANTPVGNGWEDSGIRWEFRHDGTWVRINENNFGSRVYGTWAIEGLDSLTLRAENLGWENNTRLHTIRWSDSNRVYVTVSGSINPSIILTR